MLPPNPHQLHHHHSHQPPSQPLAPPVPLLQPPSYPPYLYGLHDPHYYYFLQQQLLLLHHHHYLQAQQPTPPLNLSTESPQVPILSPSNNMNYLQSLEKSVNSIKDPKEKSEEIYVD